MSASDRETGLRLANRHVSHLADMIDALSDVALSRRPTFSAGRVRRVDVADLIAAAADAAQLTPPRLRLAITGDLSAVAVNAQGYHPRDGAPLRRLAFRAISGCGGRLLPRLVLPFGLVTAEMPFTAA